MRKIVQMYGAVLGTRLTRNLTIPKSSYVSSMLFIVLIHASCLYACSPGRTRNDLATFDMCVLKFYGIVIPLMYTCCF